MTDVLAPRRDPADPTPTIAAAALRRLVPRGLALALLRQLPGRPGAAAARDDRPDLPLPLPARAAAAPRPDEGRPAGRRRCAQPYVQQLAVVESAYPGSTAVSMTEPRNAESPTIVSVTTAGRVRRATSTSSPYGPEVLGSINPDTTLSGTRDPAARRADDRDVGRLRHRARRLLGGRHGDHRLLPVRPRLARPAPRAQADRPNATLRSRHGLVGAVVGVGLLTLLVTGLPWTGFWGAKVQTLATERGTSMWSPDHGAVSNPTSTLDESLPHSHAVDVPWALGESEVPASRRPRRRGAQRRQRRHRGRRSPTGRDCGTR